MFTKIKIYFMLDIVIIMLGAFLQLINVVGFF